MSIGVIGGTGLYSLEGLSNRSTEQVQTRYGEVTVYRGWLGAAEMIFLPRHGVDHDTPPHRINYRANIAALKQLGVTSIIASAACGSLNRDMPPGCLVLPTQFLDFTRSRPTTFFDGEEGGAIHIDVTEPYCPRLRTMLLAAGVACGIEVADGAVYVCTEGPRFESAAEIAFYARNSGDLVGMTGLPECVLAREMEMCYATVAVVTNFAAGISPNRLTHSEVVDTMAAQLDQLLKLLEHVCRQDNIEADCLCRHSLDEYRRMGVVD